MPANGAHQPVLCQAAIDALQVKPDGVYVDGTYGRGGHAAAILDRLGDRGALWLFDRDAAAVADAQQRFADDPRCRIRHRAFSAIAAVLRDAGLSGRVDGLLLDLGVSSPQLADAERGFAFGQDGPLDMRMDRGTGQSALVWLQQAAVRDIEWVLKTYGEERFARRIAHAVVRARDAGQAPQTTAELAALARGAIPRHEPGRHPATRTFQALRIQVNDELGELRRVLDGLCVVLGPGGRLVVISFHSLEDRMVKRFMRNASRVGPLPPGVPAAPPEHQPWLRVCGKPRYPDAAEVHANPRARSAVLRVAERLQ